jgi:Rrf2 family protein
MFSRACEYAIRAVVHIAQATASDRQATVRSIAEATGSPMAYTAKVMQKLVRDGHIGSMKGPGGGFTLTAARARKLKLAAIVKSIDGDEVYTRCALGLPQCSDRNPCPLHEGFTKVRLGLRDLLERTSVHDLAAEPGLLSGSTRLKG